MEDLTRDWKKLSLTKKEGDKLDLSKNKKTQVFVLAAKFFMRRSLNVEVVAKAFRPLWRTRRAFEIHNLPYSLLTAKVAVRLGESLGVVTMPKDLTEMRGGNFMRVRVTIDILEPLCKGRCVDFDDDNEGWVSFQCERLPNMCY
ncbi:hypothetical protein SO802_009853 [Lithocarpus litseifolius]|uniref:Uncharacterized protein n=1 Tax=Lithocarpus litseifolius TaxID=425828 RepID=A0AAW2DD74_9ROSI